MIKFKNLPKMEGKLTRQENRVYDF